MPLKVNLLPTDLVRRDGKQLALLKIDNPGRARSAVISYRIQQTARSLKIEIPEGAGKHVLSFPSVRSPCSIRADVEGTIVRATVEPPRTWHIIINRENVILLCIQPAGRGRSHVIRLQETAGKRTPCVLRFRDLKPSTAYVTDLYGGRPRPVPVKGRTIRRTLAPRELVTLKVVL